jgi:periplasmic divalent cation tolerance protein
MHDGYSVVLCTCPNRDAARALAVALIENRYAACVNLVPGLSSIYHWKGGIEEAEEVLLLIKTTRERYGDVEACIRAGHPYELPEIIALPVENGLSNYLAWIDDACQ